MVNKEHAYLTYLRKQPSVGLTTILYGLIEAETNGQGTQNGGSTKNEPFILPLQIGQNSGKFS